MDIFEREMQPIESVSSDSGDLAASGDSDTIRNLSAWFRNVSSRPKVLLFPPAPAYHI